MCFLFPHHGSTMVISHQGIHVSARSRCQIVLACRYLKARAAVRTGFLRLASLLS